MLSYSKIRSTSALLVFITAGAYGQNYPDRPIRIVTSEPGGGLDFAARLIAQGIAGSLGQPVIVDNRGPGGVAAIEAVARAQPDGYTLLLYASTIWLAPLMRDNVPWDPIRDFSPVSLTTRSPNLIVVHPSVPAKSLRELMALAKSKPGDLNYGSGAVGSPSHLAAELFKFMAGVNIVRIPYKSAGPALTSLISGHVHLMFATAGGVVPHVKSGKLRALAITSATRSALMPDLPTAAASGVPGYESVSLVTIFAPAQTPPARINRLNQEIVRFLGTAEAKERFFSAGVETVGSSPEQLAATMKSEMARMGKVIKDAGIREE